MSRVAHILPTGMYNLPSGATITDESNMYTTVDSETYASVLSQMYPSVGYFDFSVLPDSAIVQSFELLIKTASSTTANSTNTTNILNFGSKLSVLNNSTSIPFRQNPEITSIDLDGVTWNDIISNKSVLNISLPSRSDRANRFYGIEFRVTYDLPVNKVVYGTTVLVDLTADTVTPGSLLQGYTAHDQTGALITGTADITEGSVYQDGDGYLVVDDSESSAPQGNISITENGTYDVADYAGATVSVGGGGDSPYTLLDSSEFSVSTASTSACLVGTIEFGNALYTADAIIYVKVRDKAGKRNGFFYGTDTFFVNPYAAKGTNQSLISIRPSIVYSYDGNGLTKFNPTNSGYVTMASSSSYGVYAYSITGTGNVTIYSRYTSSITGTIDGTYTVDTYLLKWPDDISPITQTGVTS